MALDIPNVPGFLGSLLQGINTGGGLYSKLMQPILSREELAQKAKQHKDEMALRRAELARAGANADIQRQLLQQQLLSAQHANDPMYAFNQYKTLQDMIRGKTSTSSAPSELAGQGMGLFAPEGLSNEQAMGGNAGGGSNFGGIDLELLKKNPALRGFFKHQFGYDPLAMPQTPEEKNAAALDLFKQKEAIKQANKSGDIATNKVLTQNQQAVQAIDTVIPMIDELINNPDSIYGAWDFSPSKKAAYNAKTGGMIDMLVAAQSLPQVQESVNLVEEQIRRGTGEDKDAYKKRLQEFRKDLLARKKKSVGVVDSKKVDTSVVTPEETKTLNGVKYEKINGEWHVAD